MDCEQILQALQHSGKDWVDYLSALLTPTIAILGSLIAFQQWLINRKRLKHELFDRRYQQFCVVRDFLGSIITYGTAKKDEQLKYLSGTRGMRFIFDKDLADSVEKTIWNPAVMLDCLNSELECAPDEEERAKNAKRQSEIFQGLKKELNVLEDTFSKYLQLKH
jgi:hypothetical protein